MQIQKFKMAAAAILNFEKLLPFLYYSTDFNQIWWGCSEFDAEHTCHVEKHIVMKIQDGGSCHTALRKTAAISLLFDQSSPNLMGMLQIPCRTHLSC
jgi:hypothetical protein